MRDHNLRRGVTFLSLDVEGAEEIVLRTVDPSWFKYMMVEAELDVSDKHTLSAVDSIIQAAGMIRAREIGGIQFNTVYRNPSQAAIWGR